MSLADDDVVLGVLRSAHANLEVYDGDVRLSDADRLAKVISVPLPYLVFHSAPGSDRAQSLAGTSGARLLTFRVTFVGGSREEAKAASEIAEGVLKEQVLSFPAGERLVTRTDNNLPVRRDDAWTRPQGKPLFYGVDEYVVLT
ncbi:hypothetical protein [Nocardioides sp. R-C-SC26]|uniref:hypothetical protein n=1 Tax=Nocardioides sp. R-C-SC26 TaxID=2870414 RepID=UPI001E30193F|nr:hypothetical protein [Nocardioides sp. R-C-SC26]